MAMCFRVKDGKCAIWQKPLSGDKFAPFDNPTLHMSAVRFHSDLQYLSNAIQTTATINHTSLAGITGTGVTGAPVSGGSSSGSAQPIMDGDIRVSDHTLYTHGLGVVPQYQVLYNGEIISGLTRVQLDGDGQARLVGAYATSSIIGLREIAVSTDQALSAASRTYTIIIFRNPAPDMSKGAVRIKPGTEVYFGYGKVNDSQKPLRRAVPSDPSPFYIPQEPPIAVGNGGFKTVSPISGPTILNLYNGPFYNARALKVSF